MYLSKFPSILQSMYRSPAKPDIHNLDFLLEILRMHIKISIPTSYSGQLIQNFWFWGPGIIIFKTSQWFQCAAMLEDWCKTVATSIYYYEMWYRLQVSPLRKRGQKASRITFLLMAHTTLALLSCGLNSMVWMVCMNPITGTSRF